MLSVLACISRGILFVPERRLELLHLAARVPETRASTNSAIRALWYAQTGTLSTLFLLYEQSSAYLISLCKVCFFIFGLYFFKIRRSVVFFLFFVVVYLETVCPSFLASVHSSVITILFSFPFAMVTPIRYELYKS